MCICAGFDYIRPRKNYVLHSSFCAIITTFIIFRLPWVALERWTNLSNETIESDVYSFGMTIWEIFSHGERPFSDLHTMDEVWLLGDKASIDIENRKHPSCPRRRTITMNHN